MQITLRLAATTFSGLAAGAISLGAPIDLVIESDSIMPARYATAEGWFELLPHGQQKALVPLGNSRFAFCGQIDRVVRQVNDIDVFDFVRLDCGLPISMIFFDLDAEPDEPAPKRKTWVGGVAHLTAETVALDSHPVARPITATITAIDRLVLRTGPGFGHMRSEGELPPIPFTPDEIYLTLRLHEDW